MPRRRSSNRSAQPNVQNMSRRDVDRFIAGINRDARANNSPTRITRARRGTAVSGRAGG